MDILKNFGFEWTLFFAQIVNFLIIFFLMKKLLYKPLLKMLEDRKHKIAEGLKNAEAANKKLEEMMQKEEEILGKAQEQAMKLIEEAKKQQTEIMKQTEITTRLQTEKMLKDARDQIAFESAQVEKRLMSHVSKLAVQFLQQSVQELFGANEQEAIMKNALKKLKEKRAD